MLLLLNQVQMEAPKWSQLRPSSLQRRPAATDLTKDLLEAGGYLDMPLYVRPRHPYTLRGLQQAARGPPHTCIKQPCARTNGDSSLHRRLPEH